MKKYFEYKVSNTYHHASRCLTTQIVECSKEKTIENAKKHSKLIDLIDRVWNEYGETKKTRHGRDYSIE